MYFAFLWMDRWLKIMEAFTAEQERIAESRSEDQITADDELANLRSALTDREHALLAALRHGKELESALTRQRDAAEERHADYLREIADRTRVAEEAEDRLKAELRTATQRQAEVTRLEEALLAAHEEMTTVKKDIEQTRGELKAAKSEIERLAGALEKAQAEVKTTRDESKRLASEIAETRVQAETARNDYEKHLAELNRKLTQVERRSGADPEPVKLEEQSKKPRGIRKAKTATPNVPQHPAAPEVAPKPETSVDGFVLHFQKPADWSERVFVYY
jgi:chromosome segregation ATPase